LRNNLDLYVKRSEDFFNNSQIWLNTVNVSLLSTSFLTWDHLLSRLRFAQTYYLRNENLWVDGFLLDFLQKKTVDLWTRQYVIHTGFLFSEKLVFDNVVRIYIDNIIWPMHRISAFESSSIGGMINTVIFIYFGLLVLIMLALSLFIS
jgi:hypothetical protein